MLRLSAAQTEELKSLNARIGQFDEQIKKEGPIIDQIQELRGKVVKLERQAKGDRMRKMSLARKGARGKAIRRRKSQKGAGELEVLYEKMKSLEGSLDKIEELKDQRIAYIERRRALLKEVGARLRIGRDYAAKITEEKERLELIEESIDKIRRASKLLKRASSIMKGAKQHISKAKTASVFDIVGVGGVVGELTAEYVKHKSMGKARTAMAPAKRCVREANKLLKSLNLRGSGAGPDIPQLNAFVDIALDGWFDIGVHDKITQAEFSTEMSTKRVARRAKELQAVEEAFHQQRYRVEENVYELLLEAESAEAARIVHEAET